MLMEGGGALQRMDIDFELLHRIPKWLRRYWEQWVPRALLAPRRRSQQGGESHLDHQYYGDWSALPVDVLFLVAQRLSAAGHTDHLAALMPVCKAWYTSLKVHLNMGVAMRSSPVKEPYIIFWKDREQVMMLYHPSKGWSPLLESCIPLHLRYPILSLGPWLLSWRSKVLHRYNLVTKQYTRSHFPYQKTLKVGIMSERDATVLCISGPLHIPSKELEAFTICVEAAELMRRRTSYHCRPSQPHLINITCSSVPQLCVYEDSDNMIVFNDERCAFFSVVLSDSRSTWLLFWYNWESRRWGCKSRFRCTSYCSLFGHTLIFWRPLVKIKGRLGLVKVRQEEQYMSRQQRRRYASGRQRREQFLIEICILNSGVADLETKIDCTDPRLECVVMPSAVFSKFVDIVREALDSPLRRTLEIGRCEPLVVTNRQCNDKFVHMFCTLKAWLVAVIVYDVDQDAWNVIPFRQVGNHNQFGSSEYCFALPVTADSYLAKAALSARMK